MFKLNKYLFFQNLFKWECCDGIVHNIFCNEFLKV